MTDLADALPKDVGALQALILAERAAHAAEAERLRQIIKEMQRHRFGRRAETLPIDQLDHLERQAIVGCAQQRLEHLRIAREILAQPAGRAPRLDDGHLHARLNKPFCAKAKAPRPGALTARKPGLIPVAAR